MARGDNDENEKPATSESRFSSIDTGLVTTDLVALLVASQLLGLLNVLNRDDFVQKGGWLQPVTLGSLQAIPDFVNIWIQLSLSWGLVGLINSQVWKSADEENDEGRQRQRQGVLKNLVGLLTCRWVLIQLFVADVPIEQSLALGARDTYIAGLVLLAARFVLNRI